MSEDGYLITNFHVVSSAGTVEVLLSSGETYAAATVGGDETSDLMVLKIDAEKLTPAEFGASDTMEVGDSVVAIGDPLGTELRGTMTDGIICGIQRDILVEDRTMSLLQTNAALNSGNSGGPLVNMAGQVIGINTMKLSSNYTAVEGIGFAIPISTAKPIVDELVEQGYVSGPAGLWLLGPDAQQPGGTVLRSAGTAVHRHGDAGIGRGGQGHPGRGHHPRDRRDPGEHHGRIQHHQESVCSRRRGDTDHFPPGKGNGRGCGTDGPGGPGLNRKKKPEAHCASGFYMT